MFIVIEYVEGLNLYEYIEALKEREMFIPQQKFIQIILDLISVLKYLHKDKAIVHKDLNPSNIMLSFDFKIVVTDFGLSHPIADLTRASRPDSFAGTLAYSSPEMVNNKFYTELCDIWSLGCIIYEILESKPAFTGNNPLLLARDISGCKYERIVREKYRFLGKTGEKLIDLVEMCLEEDVEKRINIKEITR